MRAGDERATLSPDQRAAADAGLKAMIPVGSSNQGRPFLDHVLHSLADAEIHDVALVLGPAHDEVRDRYGRMPMSRLRIDFLIQHAPLGTADALLTAEAWTAGEPFIVLNSDNLYPVDVLARLRDATGPAVPGFERDSLRLPLERIGTFALLERGPGGCLSRIVEKPGTDAAQRAGAGALVSMNVWRFDARIFDACRDVAVSERGEKELPQAAGLAAARGACIEVIPVRGEVLDLSSRGDIAAVARRLDGVEVTL